MLLSSITYITWNLKVIRMASFTQLNHLLSPVRSAPSEWPPPLSDVAVPQGQLHWLPRGTVTPLLPADLLVAQQQAEQQLLHQHLFALGSGSAASPVLFSQRLHLCLSLLFQCTGFGSERIIFCLQHGNLLRQILTTLLLQRSLRNCISKFTLQIWEPFDFTLKYGVLKLQNHSIVPWFEHFCFAVLASWLNLSFSACASWSAVVELANWCLHLPVAFQRFHLFLCRVGPLLCNVSPSNGLLGPAPQLGFGPFEISAPTWSRLNASAALCEVSAAALPSLLLRHHSVALFAENRWLRHEAPELVETEWNRLHRNFATIPNLWEDMVSWQHHDNTMIAPW